MTKITIANPLRTREKNIICPLKLVLFLERQPEKNIDAIYLESSSGLSTASSFNHFHTFCTLSLWLFRQLLHKAKSNNSMLNFFSNPQNRRCICNRDLNCNVCQMNKEQLFVRVIGSLENCISEKSELVSLKYLCVGGGGNDWDTPSSLFRRGLTGVTVNVNWDLPMCHCEY